MAEIVTTHSKYKGVIVSKFNMRKIRDGLKRDMQDVANRIIKHLTYIGEECIRIARESGQYNDITGNLRSSIGYVVLYDGKVVQQSTEKVFSGEQGNGEAGPPAAKALLKKLQTKFPYGITLVVCAGMNYAAYVENIYHKDVLTSAELRAESLLKTLLKGVVK